MTELWSSQVLYYAMRERWSNFVQERLEFDEEIDRTLLQKAADRTIARYPYFKVKIEKCGEELVLVENEAPFLVYEDAEAPTMEPEKNHGYLLRISATGSLLTVSFCHSIADGRGFAPFVKTLLHEYWILKTGKAPGIPDVHPYGSPVPESESRDALLDFKPDPEAVTLPEGKEPVFLLPVKGEADGTEHLFTFSMNADSFMKYSHEIDGSPNAVMALFMSRAIQRIHPDAQGITAGVAADYRHALGSTDEHTCRIGLLYLPYQSEMQKMDISTCATIFRGRIILQDDDRVLRGKLASTQQFSGYLKSLPTLEEKCRISEFAVQKGTGSVTFSVSYIGKQEFGDINSHLRFMAIAVDAEEQQMTIEIMCVKEKFFITVSQGFADEVYVKELVKELEAEGIACTGFKEQKILYEKGPVARQYSLSSGACIMR